MVGRVSHASILLCSGSNRLYLLYFDKAKETVRRRSDPNSHFFMETKKKKKKVPHPTLINYPPLSRESRLLNQGWLRLCIDPNEVSVSLLFHEKAQRPCALNPDLRRPQEMRFTALVRLREARLLAKSCSLIAA